MKVPPQRISAFLRKPDPGVRAVLVYGPDGGLVRERADMLAKSISPDLADPFRVTDLTAAALVSDPARLADELGAQSLIGGRRVVRVREATDRLAPIVVSALEATGGDTLAILEGGELETRKPLRKLFDAGKAVAAIACYPDSGRDLAEVVRETLGRHQVRATRDALDYLVANLGGDRLVTRSELEKLALYVGDGGEADLEAALLSVGDTSLLSIDDVVLAVAAGDLKALERALQRALLEGESPVTIVRATARYFSRLQPAAALVAGGQSPEAVVQSLRPPVFFKLQAPMIAALGLWSPARVARALELLLETELSCKRTILPADTMCRAGLAEIAGLVTRRR